MRRKILMGVLALALPAGTIAAFSPVALAGAPDNAVTCAGFGATVTFGAPLTVAGVATATKLGTNTSVGSTSFTCTGGTAPNTGGAGTSPALSIAGGKNTKLLKTDPRYNKTLGIKYVTGTWSEFAAAGGGLKKSLKSIDFHVAGHDEPFKAKSSSIVVGGLCGGDVGFNIVGQVKAAPYNNKATAHVLACLGADHRTDNSTGTFLGDYLVHNGVDSAQIDPAVSVAVL